MLSPEEDNRAASESEVKVTLSATEADEPIRKYSATFFIEPANKPRSTSKVRLRRDPAGRNKPCYEHEPHCPMLDQPRCAMPPK
jgi:hypothetical protein